MRRSGIMLDTTTEITKLITSGTTEQALLIAVALRFPELTQAELSRALQVATAAAERSIEVPMISRRYQAVRSERIVRTDLAVCLDPDAR
jgi:hypothetical protein